MKISFLLIIFLTLGVSCFAQTTIKGTISSKGNKPLPYASVVVKDSLNQKIINYGFSDDKGQYVVIIETVGTFNLNVSSLGFQPSVIPVVVSQNPSEINQNIVLQEAVTTLDEVVISAEKPLSIGKDTINIKTKFFTDGTEETVEDLLKKIPGLNVDDNGTIKVGNQEIEKLMVDGDDLFERGYKLLSKNMPAYPIDEVEVLKRFSNNRLLKNIEESNKVALNLKLNENAKRIWFGNIKTSIGNDSFYELKANLMNFGKKNKYYFFSNLNSIGYDAIGDINSLIRPYRTENAGIIGDDQQIQSILNLSTPILDFKRSRTNFNNAELLSLNAIFNPTEKLKIKTLGFFNWDETDFFRNALENVSFNSTNFTNTEDYKLKNKKHIAFGKLDFTYNISKTKMLEGTTKYNNGDFNDVSNLLFNEASTVQSLEHQNTLIDQNITYTNKINDRRALLLTGRFINEKAPQNYQINRFNYEDLFANTTANNVEQQIESKLEYLGLNAHLLNRTKNNDLFELQLGNEYRKNLLNSNFSLFEDDNLLLSPDGYQNETTYKVNDLYIKSAYRKKLKDVAITGRLNAHQLFNTLVNNTTETNESPFFINPSVGFDWNIDKTNKVNAAFSHTTTNARILDVYSDFVLTGFRTLRKGTASFNQLEASSFNFNYQFRGWGDRFFASTFLFYTENHDFFSTNSIINQNVVTAEKILIKDRNSLTLSSRFDYYFKFVRSNLKLKLGYNRSQFKNIVNNSDLREITSRNYKYGVELRSGFSGFFNYHLGTNWITRSIETTFTNNFTDNTTFLDLNFVFNEKVSLMIQGEHYYFGNLENDNTYSFLDFDGRYTVKKDKLTLGISGKNLFNTTTFRNFNISDIGSTVTEYRLLPRYVLLKIEYRF
ncbi:carboxypeptidase-like regulatory domain-containing protein [Spongiivirga citrea]|uniref:TonB-dependent receptor n=1 Tax=Spongiivirga citrea TaxID=1481457 RepID=A0A6M0CH64_9FLAO|nr:carboxypeptidase-like regulatory domain-containing protein [Spongiivirga citrea]NER17211.1 TonB-dependent receptor [Spongiivirga citrea]